MKHNQRGSIEMIALGVVLVAVIALVGWRITVALQDQADAEDAVASTQTVVKESKSPNEIQAPEYNFWIKEWNIGNKTSFSFTPTVIVEEGGEVAHIGSTELELAEGTTEACKVGKQENGNYYNPLGSIYRYKEGSTVRDVPVAQYAASRGAYSSVNGYFYVYEGPQASCANGAVAQEMQTTQVAAMKDIASQLVSTQ